MLKVISKLDCERCAKVKDYLETREIPFEIEMAENSGYDVWRKSIEGYTGKLGFPLLLYYPEGKQVEAINGSYDEITAKLMEWYPSKEKCDHPKYDWCFCTKCNHNVV